MNRKPIENEDGRVIATFDRDAAREICSDHSYRGNRQNVYTNLLRTARGRYVMHHVNQWQGARCWYELVSAEEAAKFALQCGLDDMPDDLAAIAAKMDV